MALSLDLAFQRSCQYTCSQLSTTTVCSSKVREDSEISVTSCPNKIVLDKPTASCPNKVGLDKWTVAAYTSGNNKFYFCGGIYHKRSRCPARNAECHLCGRKGHFQKVCQTALRTKTLATCEGTYLCSVVAKAPNCLKNSVVDAKIGTTNADVLPDIGASESFIDNGFAQKAGLTFVPQRSSISMASTNFKAEVIGFVNADITLLGQTYCQFQFGVLKDLCSDVILGQDFMKLHKRITFQFGGRKPSINVPSRLNGMVSVAAANPDRSSFWILVSNQLQHRQEGLMQTS